MERINKNIFDVNNTAEKSAESKAAAAEEAQAVEASEMAFDVGEKSEEIFDNRENNNRENNNRENSNRENNNRENSNRENSNGEKDNIENSDEKSSLESEIVRLKEESLRQKSEFEAAIKELKIKSAVLERLYGEGAKNPKLLLRLIDTSGADFDEKGSLVGIDEQIDSLKNSEGYLFGGYGAASAGCFRPEEAGDFSETSKADFSHMTYSQVLRALGK